MKKTSEKNKAGKKVVMKRTLMKRTQRKRALMKRTLVKRTQMKKALAAIMCSFMIIPLVSCSGNAGEKGMAVSLNQKTQNQTTQTQTTQKAKKAKKAQKTQKTQKTQDQKTQNQTTQNKKTRNKNNQGRKSQKRNVRSDGIRKESSGVRIPDSIKKIPASYFTESSRKGTLKDLKYKTWESFSYDRKKTQLEKHAIVYLPYGYDSSRKYDVFYLMHGGWSDYTTTLGTPDAPSQFKNVLDNAIAKKEIKPLIVVCPTYNNTNKNGRDSDDYSLAMQLTRNYHNELLNDLMPAAEGKYSTYATDTTPAGFKKSRAHRGFGGFSMGSVTTWRTFEYDIDYFKYFLPMSCGTTIDDDKIWSAAKGRKQKDYFVFVMTGSSDFACGYDTERTGKMAASTYFTDVDENPSGNMAFRVKKGYSHDDTAAMEYTYNGLKAFFFEKKAD